MVRQQLQRTQCITESAKCYWSILKHCNITLGSWINAAPCLPPGGNSPVVMYFRHSIIVYINTKRSLFTVLNRAPEWKVLLDSAGTFCPKWQKVLRNTARILASIYDLIIPFSSQSTLAIDAKYQVTALSKCLWLGSNSTKRFVVFC